MEHASYSSVSATLHYTRIFSHNAILILSPTGRRRYPLFTHSNSSSTLIVVWYFLHLVLINAYLMDLYYANLTSSILPKIPFTKCFGQKTYLHDLKGKPEEVSIFFLHLEGHYSSRCSCRLLLIFKNVFFDYS